LIFQSFLNGKLKTENGKLLIPWDYKRRRRDWQDFFGRL
jgi:hypothetical protein